ncbi:MAG: tRNA (adenosine(37)-N6)-threonylcarbamoyltransferase complex transferase subunit TsaD [Rhizobiaceae bacterium]
MKSNSRIVLGIETSCDETAASVVAFNKGVDGPGNILSNVVLSQIEDHAPFGGVVPEIAARAHLETLDGVIHDALERANSSLADLDAIAVTSGPGLAGGLIVGTMTARAIAAVHNKTLFNVNHLEGHALTARLTDGVKFPYLLLLVSGGHTQILLVRGVGDYQRWATTIDDALGEAFDKTAKLLGLPYPGGPQVENAALNGNPKAFAFPRPLKGRDTLDMSFSGLKTAVRITAQENVANNGEQTQQAIANICASFQSAVGDILEDRISRAFLKFEKQFGAPASLIVAGGVAANDYLRERLKLLSDQQSWQWVAPPAALCTDNAAMIAWVGIERLILGLTDTEQIIRSRWPLDPEAAATGGKKFGTGKKGAKA